METEMKQNWWNKRDIILIVIVIVVGIGAGLLVHHNRQEGQEVVVSVDGEEVNRFPLSRNAEYEITGYKGKGTNRLVIDHHSAWVQEADCPDLVCAKHSPISKEGETIICMPHRVIVGIEG
jgi:hypothetical protein